MTLVGVVVFLAHSEPSAHDMEGDTAAMSDAMSICLAVLQVGAGILIIGNLIRSYRRRLRAPATTARTGSQIVKLFRDPGHRIREGPSVLQVFRH